MHKEVEILVPVLEEKAHALSVLRRFGEGEIRRTTDRYFKRPDIPALMPGEDGRLRQCLRLRTQAKGARLTFKDDHFDEDGRWTYSDEHEVAVSDSNEAATVLELLGFSALAVLESEKHVFLSGDYECVLEDVVGLGLFLEVECKHDVDEGDVPMVKIALRDFIGSLGLRVGNELDAGKPELFLRNRARRSE